MNRIWTVTVMWCCPLHERYIFIQVHCVIITNDTGVCTRFSADRACHRDKQMFTRSQVQLNNIRQLHQVVKSGHNPTPAGECIWCSGPPDIPTETKQDQMLRLQKYDREWDIILWYTAQL